MIEPLPLVSSLSLSVLSFLDTELHTADDLQQAPRLVSELQDCHILDQSLADLNQRLGTSLLAYAAYSDEVGALFYDINAKLSSFQSSLSETTFKPDTLVADIEDAVSSSVNRNLRKQTSSQNSEEARFAAINAVKLAEDVLTKVSRTRPRWSRLISAVDHRVDRALAILRPQAIADYRSLLTSLNWPPPLSTLNHSNPEANNSAESTNPRFTMRGDLKRQYCDSFLALCKHKENPDNFKGITMNLLWAIEELVIPISIASQRHFSKWSDKPELIFSLVYKITQDYVTPMDELLQPLVDEAMLAGYLCREEWISAMVSSLSTYMGKEIFPIYISQLDEESTTENPSLAKVSWLHFTDLMISFDKKVKSLVTQSGITLSLEKDGNIQKISSLSVFCDRPDWLDFWAEIEVSNAIEKLRPEIKDESIWLMEIQESGLVSGSESYGSPAISSAFLRRLSSIIEHFRSIPCVSLRARFIRLTGAPIINHFLCFLLLRCQEAEGLTALTDDDALIKVTTSINASGYFESTIKYWCEEVFFLEMKMDSGGIIDEEISKLEKFRIEWVEKLSTGTLRRFDAAAMKILKTGNNGWKLETTEEGWAVSKSFIGALDYLQTKMTILEANIVGVWRNLATAIDSLLFSGIFTSSAKV